MLARLSAFVIWALVAATAVFWGLRLLVRAPQAPAYAVPVGDATAVRADLTRLLGSAPVAAVPVVAAPEAASRFKLWGVVAPREPGAGQEQHGVALIAVDGKMPKAYPVGARIDDDLVLQSVSLRSASIAPSGGAGQTITLQLPPPLAAATGSLPLPGFGAPAMAPMPRPVPSFGQPMPAPPVAIPPVLPQPVAPRPESGAPAQ